jgi:hypothetical protein
MVLPLTQALAWKLILHVFLAGFSMYGCARAFGAGRWVALFGGVAWLLSANLVSLVLGGQDGKMYVITLFPAGLGLLVAAMNRPSLLKFVWFGAVAGLMLIAHPQLAYYAWVALGCYALVSMLARRKDGARALLARFGGGLGALVLALGVAAIVLLPMYRYLRSDSPRAGPGLEFEKAASYSLNPEEVVNFVVPDFSGVNETYWGRNPLKHNLEYGGVVVFALGLSGLLGLTGDRRRIGLGVMAGVALLYALGSTTPVFRLMYLTIPGLKNFRAPSLATFLVLAAITLLAALTLDRVFRDRNSREGGLAVAVLLATAGVGLALAVIVAAAGTAAFRPWFAIFGTPPGAAQLESNLPSIILGGALTAFCCGAAAGALLGWRRNLVSAPVALIGLSALTVIDLLRVDTRYVQVAPYEQFFPSDPGFEALRQQLGPGERVLPFPGILQGGGREGGYLATYRIPEVFGYHSNQLRWYDQLTRRQVRDNVQSNEQAQAYWFGFLESPALRALSVRVVLLPGRIPLPGYQLLGSNQHVAIYRNERALAAATVIPRVQVEPDSTRQLALLWDSTFDVAKEAVVDTAIVGLGSGGGSGSAQLVYNGADSVGLSVATSGPSLLLVSRTYHPSWKATVDGQLVAPVRADLALIGVPLATSGTHQIVLTYRPSIVARARAASMAAWALIAAFTIGTWVAGPMWRRRG